MTTNCPTCDRPRIRPEDSGTPYDPGRCPGWHPGLPDGFVWVGPDGRPCTWERPEDWTPADDCYAHRVNWRERTLAAEADNERLRKVIVDVTLEVQRWSPLWTVRKRILALLPKEPDHG